MSNESQIFTPIKSPTLMCNSSLINFYPEIIQPENIDQSPKPKLRSPVRKDSVRLRRHSLGFDKNQITTNSSKNIISKEEYELNDTFFNELFKKPCHLDKDRVTKTISTFIRKSQLIKKLENEFESENNKFDFSQLSDICAQLLSYIFLEKGKVLFRIGDLGDRFYFIIKGNRFFRSSQVQALLM